jgi:hypothetical protein
VPSLRHSSDREPGYTRRRQGKGWRYLDADGLPDLRRVTAATRPSPRPDPWVIDHFLDGRTISSLVGEVDSRMRDGHSSEELAVLRRGLEERAPATSRRRRAA